MVKQMRAKLSDVASAAGVSKATASNVFSAPQKVSPELQRRVKEAALALGYAGPDPKGRLLSGGRANAIAVVPPGDIGITIAFRHPYMTEFLAGVADICEEHGAGLQLVSGIEGQKAEGIRNALVDGFIFGSLEEADLIEPSRRGRVPFVLMDVDAGPDVNSVRVDDRGGARQAARHLIDLGHRRFGIVTVLRHSHQAPVFHGPSEAHHRLTGGYHNDRERLAGVAEELATVGISINDVPIVEVFGGSVHDPTFGGATVGVAMLLDNAPDMTAIITLGDTQNLAVLSEIRRRNIRFPRDLSVVGFDDPPQLALFEPPLTTIVQPVAEKGRAAARILFEGGPPKQVVLPVELAVRGSTALPRK